jgi:hypothetical protein
VYRLRYTTGPGHDDVTMPWNSLMSWGRSWLEQALLRRAPQDDAFSYPALAAALSAYVTVDLLQGVASSAWPPALSLTAADTVLMVLFAWLVLRFSGKAARFVQTLTALSGTGALLGLIGLPLVMQAVHLQQSGGQVSASLAIAWLLLLGWSIAVQAHIFRHALSTSYSAGFLVAGLRVVLGIGLLELLYPGASGG